MLNCPAFANLSPGSVPALRVRAAKAAPILSVVAALLLGGCATPQRPDPLEAMNRKVFGLNETIDKAVMAPVARGYERVVPEPVRGGVRNFFANPRDLGSGVNLVLQGRPKEGLTDLARVATNTTVGVLGVFDVATPLGLPRHSADLGQTLGRWGVGSGAYVVLPLLGPSTVRDTANVPVDMALTPQNFVSNSALGGGLSALQFASKRADLLPATRLLDDAALDRYLFVRDTYLQRRQSLVLGASQPERSDDGSNDSVATPATSH